MSGTAEPLDDLEYLFLRKDNAGTSVALFAIGGCVALAFAVFGFILSLVTRPGMLAMQAMTTLPTLFGLGALTSAWSISRSPRQITVGPDGISIDNRNGTEMFEWGRIGWVNVSTDGLNQRKKLVIYDVQGKTLATISDAFDDFDHLTRLVRERIDARGDDTADRLRHRKSKRSSLFLAGAGIGLLALVAGNLWMARQKQREERLLAEAAVPGEAEILRRFMAPDGVTARLEYRVVAPDGQQGTRNAEVTRAYWDSLEGATTVPVTYVTAEPEFSRLVSGEVLENDLTGSPAVTYTLCAVLAAICLFLLGAAVLQWRGWDIDLDSKTGKISIKRFGTGR